MSEPAASASAEERGAGQHEFDLALNYIKLIEDAAVRTNHTAGRLYLIRVILTLVVLALALGIASIKETFELAGLSFEVKLWLLLVVSSIFALVMWLFDVPYYERAHQLAWRAAGLYEELGYHVPRDAFHSAENPLGLQFAAVAPHGPLTRRLSYRMASAGGQVLAALLLFATQVYVFLRLNHDFDGPAVWCFALVPLATLFLGCAMFIVTMNSFRRGEKPWYGTPTKRPLTIHAGTDSARRGIAQTVRSMCGRLSRLGR